MDNHGETFTIRFFSGIIIAVIVVIVILLNLNLSLALRPDNFDANNRLINKNYIIELDIMRLEERLKK